MAASIEITPELVLVPFREVIPETYEWYQIPEIQSLVNGQTIGAQARKLADNDVLQLAGVKMGFFAK